MPATFVVDASVVVEFLAPGELTAAATRFMSGLRWREPMALIAPDLLFLEAASALDRLSRRQQLSGKGADRAVARLSQLPLGAVPTAGLLQDAWKLRKNSSIYDASYLALARGLELPLVTADRRLAKAARSARIKALEVDGRELKTLLDALEMGSM